MKKTSLSSWVNKNCKFAYYEDDDDEPKLRHVQWMSDDKQIFFPAGRVVKALSPGCYDIEMSQSGIYFSRIRLGEENILRLPDPTCDKVVEEIETFWDKESLFRENKLAYKRGIILYGPPGTGKTCTIKLVMNNIINKRNGIVVRWNRFFEAGAKILREIQKDTPLVVLMEDLDAILERNNESDVINTLDGVIGIDKTVFLATTNYPEKLGARIMNRPSRFDKRFEILPPDAKCRKFYLEEVGGDKIASKDINKWVDDTEGMSLAHLKELIVAVTILGDKYEDAISTLKEMKLAPHSRDFEDYGHPGNVEPIYDYAKRMYPERLG